MIGGSLADRMRNAGASPHPLGKGSLQSTPIATGKNGQMYRIVTADTEEVCINGEVPGDPADIEKIPFILSSHDTPDAEGISATSKFTKPLNSTGASTQFQSCFDNTKGIFNAKTKYLVIRPDKGLLAPGAAGVWRFDDDIRGM